MGEVAWCWGALPPITFFLVVLLAQPHTTYAVVVNLPFELAPCYGALDPHTVQVLTGRVGIVSGLVLVSTLAPEIGSVAYTEHLVRIEPWCHLSPLLSFLWVCKMTWYEEGGWWTMKRIHWITTLK